ncbi:thiolase [Bordetella ansorpii]|uniref:Thiolase n=2 Tax=Bordetella ansorpii TaxID=288768 RepID=A0A157SIU9_9BORD|nr:thiolase [Bordetella ansorpii]
MVGVGTTDYGSFPDTDAYGLGAIALNRALDDAGLRHDELDGLIVCRIPSYERFAEITRLNPQYCHQMEAPGRFSGVSLMLAAQALATGAAKNIALVYANNGRSAGATYGGNESALWAPWGFTSPGASHAMMFRRHMEQFGTSSEDLAHIAMAMRRHATLNPQAVRRDPMTVADHQNSRYVCDPLRLYDYCQINDGGVAWIMTTADRAKDLPKRPVYVSGFARQDAFTHASLPPDDYWYPELQEVSRLVYQRAGIDREAIDGLMIYDNFTPTVLFSLEGMGFCDQGEGGAFVRDGMLELGIGRWPTNTSGGHLSESYMQGWALIAEMVRQLRGECDDRQIPDCQALQYICATNIAHSIILRN